MGRWSALGHGLILLWSYRQYDSIYQQDSLAFFDDCESASRFGSEAR